MEGFMTGIRLKHWSIILFPVLVSIYLYRRSFRIWFMADDFAWLGLGLSILQPGDLTSALFSPMAQGTIRTLSERLFFLVFERSFGMEALPMRLAAFATFAAAQVLLVLIVRRMTGSLATGMVASLLWSVNFGVTIAMSWLSSFNQVLLSALFLGAFYGFLRYTESLSSPWLFFSWSCYLLGFGALENIIMLPGVLLMWAFFFDRSSIRRTLPYFAPAIAFTVAHVWLIPKAKDAPAYRMYFDSSLLESVGIYWNWLLGAARLIQFDPAYEWVVQLSHLILTPALLGFLVWRTWRKDYLPLFLCLVSLALLAPMLPLRDHRTDYYLASASLGMVSMIALIPMRLPRSAAIAGWVLIAVYAIPSFILQQSSIEWYLNRTAPLRPLIRGLQHAAKLHPGKMILLEGISDSVYNSSIADDALRLIPGAEIRLVPNSGPAGNPLVLSPATARTAFEKQTVIVYRFDGVVLRDVTREWELGKGLTLSTGLSPEVLAGDPAFSSQFVSGWYHIEESHRWMAAGAAVRLGWPQLPKTTLSFQAYAPKELESFELEVLANAKPIYKASHSSGPVELSIPIPADLPVSDSILIEFRCSKTVRPPSDGRILSLLFTEIAIR
jgi:hypothetical protein